MKFFSQSNNLFFNLNKIIHVPLYKKEKFYKNDVIIKFNHYIFYEDKKNKEIYTINGLGRNYHIKTDNYFKYYQDIYNKRNSKLKIQSFVNSSSILTSSYNKPIILKYSIRFHNPYSRKFEYSLIS